MDIQSFLSLAACNHSHLCPRQILGVRIGLAGMIALGFDAPPDKKRLLTITETDGCFVDGLSVATQCTVGHRTLRVEDYGKVAATFTDTRFGRSVRVAPVSDIRRRACLYAPDESRHYFAQMQAYQMMPDEEMFIVTEVQLTESIEAIISHPGIRVNCEACGEEIMNEREIKQDGLTLCYTCARGGYYRAEENAIPCLPQQVGLES